jgi:hypothetical protein
MRGLYRGDERDRALVHTRHALEPRLTPGTAGANKEELRETDGGVGRLNIS